MTERTRGGRGFSIALGLLQIFIGVGGVPAGLIFITDPSGSGMGFSLELLEGTPFSNYLLPGVFLFAVNGVASLVGGVLSLVRHRYAGAVAVALGTLLIAWIVIQVALIGLVHWLQPLYFGLGVVEVVLGLLVWRRGCIVSVAD